MVRNSKLACRTSSLGGRDQTLIFKALRVRTSERSRHNLILPELVGSEHGLVALRSMKPKIETLESRRASLTRPQPS